MRKLAELSAATTTPAAASGERETASIGRKRGASGVAGWGDLVSVIGNSAAQNRMARML